MTQTNKVEFCKSYREKYVNSEQFASTCTVLTEDDGIPGSKLEREAEEYTVDQLKRWLNCRGSKLSGKRDELVECVRYCIKSGVHYKLDPSIDNGKWFASKVLKESSYLQENGNLTSPPFIPSTGRRAFPSNNIPSLFNYGHVHYYALESILLNLDNTEDIEDGLGTYD